MKGLGVVLVDDNDKLILDPSSAIVNGFDYGMPLKVDTVTEVKKQIATMYDESNRRQGCGIDPGLLWFINTSHCRLRLLYAMFSEPSAFDFTSESEFTCDCDNCTFPERTATNRLIPPAELTTHMTNARLTRGQRAVIKQGIGIEFREMIEKREEELLQQAAIGQTVYMGFPLDKTIRYRDTAAFEEYQITNEVATIEEKASDRNPKQMQTFLKNALREGWDAYVKEERVEQNLGLLGRFIFPDEMVAKIAASTKTIEFALEGGKERFGILIGRVDVDDTFLGPHVDQIRNILRSAVVTYTELQNQQDEEAREAGQRRRSESRSSIGTVASVAGGGTGDTTGGVGEEEDLFCPFCYRGGYTARNTEAMRRHIGTGVHSKAVGAIQRQGVNHPRFLRLLEFNNRWNPNEDDGSTVGAGQAGQTIAGPNGGGNLGLGLATGGQSTAAPTRPGTPTPQHMSFSRGRLQPSNSQQQQSSQRQQTQSSQQLNRIFDTQITRDKAHQIVLARNIATSTRKRRREKERQEKDDNQNNGNRSTQP